MTDATTSPYPHLMEPLQVRNLHLRNRTVMGAMHTRLESMDRPEERIQAFYRARAEGEIGRASCRERV